MASIDPRFFCTSDLDTYYVDNASGLPMSGGIVTFYSDVNRTVLKPVYQLTGTPGNYTYAPLNNPCTLSSSGTFQDALGNNIVPYYYPFTGTPDQNTGVQELYYITCVNSGFVPQFTRQGWPQAAGSEIVPVNDNEVDNFIPNGQFLSHNNIVSITEPPITQYAYGSQTVDSQAIAQGGWNFVYTNGTTATFNNSFTQIPTSGGWGINSFPKFIFNFVCSSFNTTAITRDLRIQWPDVNKFSSGNPPGTIPYTLFFDAKSNDGNTYVFNLYKIYFFGTAGNGGSPSAPVEELVGQFTVGPSQTLVSHNITNILFSVNLGTTGANGDDYVALSIRGPASGWNVGMSDFLLAQGNETFTSFPVQTNDQMLSRGVAGWMPTPNPDGSDLYLPLVLTPQGMTFDHAQVATIVAKMTTTAVNNELFCDGSSYKTSDYSALGIPYSRLQAALYNSTVNGPIFGTGTGWVNSYINSGNVDQLIISWNITGAQTNPADGTTATGFTFPSTHLNAGAASIGYEAFANASTFDVTAISTFTGGTNGGALAATGTSTMTIYNNNQGLAGSYYSFVVTALAASSLAAGSGNPGKYFTFSSNNTNYFIWFFINGETNPAPGGTGIVCNLVSTMAAKDVAIQIANVISRFQNFPITITGQPSGGAGAYFTFTVNSVSSAVWYQINGVGIAPTATNLAMVALTGTENADQVTAKTQTAINSLYFSVPDLRGVFLRGLDVFASPNWDIDIASRVGLLDSITLDLPGTLQFMQMQTHNHTPLSPGVDFVVTAPGGGAALATDPGSSTITFPATTNPTGGDETRPVNIAVNYFIKY